MKLRVLLLKEVESIEQAQTLYNQLKTLVAPAEPIEKDGRVIDNHELEG